MDNMFAFCVSLLYFPNIEKWKINELLSINGIFTKCKSITSFPDISKWNLNKNTLNKEKIFNVSSSISNKNNKYFDEISSDGSYPAEIYLFFLILKFNPQTNSIIISFFFKILY